MLLFLVTPCLIEVVQTCMDWIPVLKNDATKLTSSAPNFRKIALHHWYFSKNLTKISEQQYWKNIWEKIFFENIPEWLLLKGSNKDIFILKVVMVIYTFIFLSFIFFLPPFTSKKCSFPLPADSIWNKLLSPQPKLNSSQLYNNFHIRTPKKLHF